MLTDEIKEQIQTAYRTYLDNKGYQARYGQRHMIATIAKALGEISLNSENQRTSEPLACAVEAGAGTGKTIAYLLATIPIAKAHKKTIVVSTGTIALQEQLFLKDLPDIKEYSGLDISFAIAKGRKRYVCHSKLEAVLTEGSSPQLPIETLPHKLSKRTLKTFKAMEKALDSTTWDGDRDSWLKPVSFEDWMLLTSDHKQCTNHRCHFFSDCVFFKARQQLETVDIIVANHDLVLSDLHLGGGVVLPAPNDTLYIFDEGHHLNNKALQHATFHTRIKSTQRWFEQQSKALTKLTKQCYDIDNVVKLIDKLLPLLSEYREQSGFVYDYLAISAQEALDNIEEDQSHQHRFEHGKLPEDLLELSQNCLGFSKCICPLTEKTIKALDKALDKKSSTVSNELLEHWLSQLGEMQNRFETNLSLWRFFCQKDEARKPPLARWFSVHRLATDDLDIEVSVGPILAAELLSNLLWDKSFAAVITSATLTALNRFERLQTTIGLPETTHYKQLPSPFAYQDVATFRVPKNIADPKDPILHTRYIVETLPSLLEEEKSALVLFSSKRQMTDVKTSLNTYWQSLILAQGDYSKQEIIKRHKEQIDNGHQSVVFGLASFAEGLDLPGDYCTHVVIAKLPFSVPDHPIDASLAEWIEDQGKNAFFELSVPDASIKLTQAAGRLLRTEKDQGTITLLDPRIVTKGYGRMMLNALPPYKQVLLG